MHAVLIQERGLGQGRPANEWCCANRRNAPGFFATMFRCASIMTHLSAQHWWPFSCNSISRREMAPRSEAAAEKRTFASRKMRTTQRSPLRRSTSSSSASPWANSASRSSVYISTAGSPSVEMVASKLRPALTNNSGSSIWVAFCAARTSLSSTFTVMLIGENLAFRGGCFQQ